MRKASRSERRQKPSFSGTERFFSIVPKKKRKSRTRACSLEETQPFSFASWTKKVEGSQATGIVEVGEVVVHPSVAAAIAAAPKEEGGEAAVPFLKEQQWKTEYATAPAEVRVLQGGVRHGLG